jgi:hypothetical protein
MTSMDGETVDDRQDRAFPRPLKRRKAPGVQKIGVTNRLAVSVHQAGKTGLAHSGGPAAAAKAETSAAAARKKRRSNAPGVVVKLASAIDDISFNTVHQWSGRTVDSYLRSSAASRERSCGDSEWVALVCQDLPKIRR